MKSGDSSDPSELRPPSSGTESDSSNSDKEVEYKTAYCKFEGGDIILHSAPDCEELARIETSDTAITALSNWFRTVTHQVLRLARTPNRRDHITLRGTAICHHKTRSGTSYPPFGVKHPTAEDNNSKQWNIPLEIMNNQAITSNLCSRCSSKLKSLGFTREQLNSYGYNPNPTCPECGEEAVQLKIEQMRGVMVKHCYGRDPDHCKLSQEQLIQWDANHFGIELDRLPLFKDDPYTYIEDFSEIVKTETGGLDGVYAQPRLELDRLHKKMPDKYAGLFNLQHPNWDRQYIIPYRNWSEGLYEPALNAESD